MNVVIDTATGIIKRYGTSDFENDGQFDAGTEEMRSDCPLPPKKRGDSTDYHHWTGSAWEVIDESLDFNKGNRKLEVDGRTQELIKAGFSFSSKVFSLSNNAQHNWIALKQAVDAGVLVDPDDFPIKVTTVDDEEFDIVDSTAMTGLYGTALATAKSHYDSGRGLKVSIDAAVDQAALDAIVDNR